MQSPPLGRRTDETGTPQTACGRIEHINTRFQRENNRQERGAKKETLQSGAAIHRPADLVSPSAFGSAVKTVSKTALGMGQQVGHSINAVRARLRGFAQKNNNDLPWIGLRPGREPPF